MSEDRDQRTEEPTERRRRDFHKQGRVAFSRELVGASTFVFFVTATILFGRLIGDRATLYARGALGSAATASPRDALVQAAMAFAFFAGPVLALVLFVAIAANLLQIGLPRELTLLREGRGFKPMAHLQQLFSTAALARLGLQSVKLAIALGLFWLVIGDDLRALRTLTEEPLPAALARVAQLTKKIGITAAAAFAVLGAIDWWRTRQRLMADMRMTKEEVKREAKEEQGSPQAKSRRRQMAKQLLRNQVRSEVVKADVVVTNPTHFAVALRYKAGKMRAPKVVAKGVDHMAEQIKALAREHNIPIVENVPLARALHKNVRVGRDVPVDLYRAVAEVLAFVYRLRRGGAR